MFKLSSKKIQLTILISWHDTVYHQKCYSCKKPQNHGRIVIENRKSQLFARLLFTLCLPSLSLSHALSLSVSSSVPPAGCWIQINISICVNNEHFDSCPTNDNHIQNTVRYQQKESGKPRERVIISIERRSLAHSEL